MSVHVPPESVFTLGQNMHLLSAGLYFINTKDTTLTSQDNLLHSTPTISDSNEATEPSPHNTEQEDQAVNQVVTIQDDNININNEQEETISELDPNHLASIEHASQNNLSEQDLALPLPTNDNATVDATGEYADQVNHQVITDKARNEGYLPQEVAEDSHPASGNNITAEPHGDYAEEVNQHAINDNAKIAGYLPQDVASNTHPPVDGNISTSTEDDRAQEINQQMIDDKARDDGYLAPTN